MNLVCGLGDYLKIERKKTKINGGQTIRVRGNNYLYILFAYYSDRKRVSACRGIKMHQGV